jgi:hypothetical protein
MEDQMLDTVEGKEVYVVDITDKDWPLSLPIYGHNPEEQLYAEILVEAVQKGVIQGPGKYGLHMNHEANYWTVYKIIES